jgi:hypothetical protein
MAQNDAFFGNAHNYTMVYDDLDCSLGEQLDAMLGKESTSLRSSPLSPLNGDDDMDYSSDENDNAMGGDKSDIVRVRHNTNLFGRQQDDGNKDEQSSNKDKVMIS